jgi:hypothetical protein
MELPETIRLKIDTSSNRDLILEVVGRLQGEGIVITQDVLAAIEATLEMTEGVVE